MWWVDGMVCREDGEGSVVGRGDGDREGGMVGRWVGGREGEVVVEGGIGHLVGGRKA